MSLSPFDFANAINFTKKNLIEDDVSEKAYNAFMVNRALSYFPDTVAAANIMNQYSGIDNKLQFDFLINIIAKRKRFSKWAKADNVELLELVKEYYGYSNEKAKATISLLSPEQLEEIKKRVYKGGRK